MNGSLQIATAQPIRVKCDGPTGSYNFFSGDKLRVSLTRIGQLSSGNVSLARIAKVGRSAAAR